MISFKSLRAFSIKTVGMIDVDELSRRDGHL
jgi:hypothetical protein